MRTKYLYILLTIVASFLFAGCSESSLQLPEGDNSDKVLWKIGVTFPEAQSTATRAFDRTDFTFEDLYVAVFAEAGGVFFLEQFARADNTKPVWNEANSCWDFGVELSRSEGPRRLHLIANYPGLTLGFGEESQLIGRLLTDPTIDEHDVYWNCVDVTKIDDGFETEVQRVPLVRNFAQIKLSIEPKAGVDLDAKFRLSGYAIYNVPTRGTVAPYNSTDGSFANYLANIDGNIVCQTYDNLFNVQKYEGNVPYDTDGTLLTKLSDFKGVNEPFYIYERTNRNSSSPTSMIIKGKYAPTGDFDAVQEKYYKLDFVYVDNSTNTNIYYNILRNFIYTMNIKDVTGEGYNTIDEAIEKPASNNIAGDASIDDYTNISDGKSRLFVSTTYMVFTSDEPIDIYYQHRDNIEVEPNTIDNSVGVGGSVVVNAPVGDVIKSAVIASADETTGQRANWRKITITPNTPDDIVKRQEITIATDYLQRKVVLVLRKPYDLSVKVTPKHVQKLQKTPIQAKITIPAGIPSALFPLKLFISTDNNTIDPKPGTNMPAETMNGTYGFIKELSYFYYDNPSETGDGRNVAIKEADGRISFITDFRTNCEESAAVLSVYNQYFNTGSDWFDNGDVVSSVTIGTSIGVSIQKSALRYPQRIYNNGDNNGIIADVKVFLNGVDTGKTITIDRDNVVSGITFEDYGDDGINLSQVLTFKFSDKYYLGGNNWSTETVEYVATCTLKNINDGTTLEFKADIPESKIYEIEIPTSTAVTVETEEHSHLWTTYNVYPLKIHNVQNPANSTEQRNNGTESVTVSIGGKNVGTITIDKDNVTVGATISIPEGVNASDTMTFTFSDKYCTGLSTSGFLGMTLRGFNFSGNNVNYEYSCTVGEFLEGVTLDFTR